MAGTARLSTLIAAFVVLAAGAGVAVPVGASPAGLAITAFPSKTGKTLTVTSRAFASGADIPFENTQYRGNLFPGLAWTRGPYGTRSFVVIMQDADASHDGAPLLHWTMYDIPAGVTRLAPGLTAPPPGASFGPNARSPSSPYIGPRTPPGQAHHYHFAVLALDETLPPDPRLGYDALAAAIAGHVLASGEIVGLGRFDPTAPPPPAHPAPPPDAH